MIVHMDMDAFFASVEELADPSLKGVPLVVAGPGERSIITTASYPARRYGIKTGMTVGQAKVLFREIKVIRSDYRKYTDASKKVMKALETITPDVRTTSVDEAYLDIHQVMDRYEDPLHLGRDLKKKVKEASGLTCSVGIASSHLLAKLASNMDKPDGLTWLKQEDVDATLEKTPVEKLCGIGPVTARKLNSMGIRTCGELGRYPEAALRIRFGSFGSRLSEMGRGIGKIHHFPGKKGRGEVKSIGHSVTLPDDIKDRRSMGKVLLTLSEMVGRRARRHNCRGKTVTLTWRYSDFTTRTRRTSFPCPISHTEDIYKASMVILNGIEMTNPVRLLGISLSDLFSDATTTSFLPEENRKEAVQNALDLINDRFGEFTLSYGDTLPDLRKLKVVSPSWRSKGIKNSY